MLYYLFRFLEQFGISGSHMWSYISFRSLLALILSLLISMWFGERFIKFLKRKQITETARDANIDPFGTSKVGVPSLGGIVIIVAILVPVLLLGRLRNVYLLLMIVTTVWLGFLGGMDDFIKIFRKNKEGLKGKYKIVGQISIGFIVGLTIWASPDVKQNNDGMDGMCAGNSAIIGVALGILAYVSSHVEFASYLNIMFIPGSEELVVFMCAFIGALVGFLWYNAYPAQVFMGDTGSLTIGGIIGVGAIVLHKELLLPILCGIFFVESLSVMIQVMYFKMGKRKGVKQRIFRRTPIHDNFRTQDSQLDPDCKYLLKGSGRVFHESKITVRFWITTIILAALTIITLKIR